MFTTTRARLTKRVGLATAVAASLMAVAATGAQAASFPAQTDGQHFKSSKGGWSASVAYRGTCLIPGVTCGLGTASWVNHGGADGQSDGFLRSNVRTIAGVLSNTAVSWASGGFTLPSSFSAVTVEYKVRGDLAQLIRLGGSATLLYRIRDVTANTSFVAIPRHALHPSNTFKMVRAGIPTSSFIAGHRYRVVLSTNVDTPLATVPSAEYVDYDDVSVVTTP